MKKILLGTNNQHKILEIHQIFAPFSGISFQSPSDIGLDLDPDETGTTYTANASLKSEAFAHASGMITLADDSGLEVDALNGAPGIYSARYGNLKGGTDKQRRDLLVQNLKDLPRPWTARFRCVIAVTVPDKIQPSRDSNNSQTTAITRTFEGICEGEIIPDERGEGGFGYDPIFLLANSDKTMAELSEKEKNKVSHRGLAGIASAPYLLQVIQSFQD